MKVMKAYKFRLYPNKEQQELLGQQFGCCRFVYNYFLQVRTDFFQKIKSSRKKEKGNKGRPKRKGLNYADTNKMLTVLKHKDNYTWLNNVIAQSLQCSLQDLDSAFSRFFSKQGSYPKFRKSRGSKQSFRVPQDFFLLGKGKKLKLPKISPIRIVVHRPVEGKIKHVTVSRTPAGKYFASLCCEVKIPTPKKEKNPTKIIGIDLGLKTFAVTSDKEKIQHPQFLIKAEKQLARLQRSLSRKKKGSKNRDKARRKVARCYEKIANQRKDFLHKVSKRLIDENQVIVVEDLSIKNMVRNRKLSKRISDSGWGEFLRQLEYKSYWYGCSLISVDRWFPSSKTCHRCSRINENLTLKDRRWKCTGCGYTHDRDLNAARNLRNYYDNKTYRGDHGNLRLRRAS